MNKSLLATTARHIKHIRLFSGIKDITWLIVVLSFSAVAVSSAGALIISMFVATNLQSSEIVRGLFSATAGFLIGLLVPSPQNSKDDSTDV